MLFLFDFSSAVQVDVQPFNPMEQESVGKSASVKIQHLIKKEIRFSIIK